MISLSIADGVAEVVLDAPHKLNSLDEQALADLSRAYDDAADAAARGEVRALLLRGEGRAFCAGRDIAGVTPESDDAQAYLGGLVQPLLKKMSAFPAPTFAAAQGACLGVGLGLLLATDVVYVAENAKVGSPFAKLGANGALKPAFFHVGATAADADDHIIYNKATGALIYDANGNAAGAKPRE